MHNFNKGEYYIYICVCMYLEYTKGENQNKYIYMEHRKHSDY